MVTGDAIVGYLGGVGGAVVDGIVQLGSSIGNVFLKLLGA